MSTLTPPTPSGDPIGIDISCQVLFLGIRTVGKVLPTRFEVLPGIGDPWIGHVCSPASQHMLGNSDWSRAHEFETEIETVQNARFSLANRTPRGGRFLASLEKNEKHISVLRGRLTSPTACCAMLRAQPGTFVR